MTSVQPLVVTAVWKEGPTNPVIREQVLMRAAAWRSVGFDSRVAFGLDPGSRDGEALERTPVPCGVFPARGVASLVVFLREVMSAGSPAERTARIMICRGALVAAAALVARRKLSLPWTIVHDARGWYTAESETKEESFPRRRTKQAVEIGAYRASDHSVVVSQALLGVALAYGADPARVTVIPQYVEPFSLTKSRLPDEPDVLYVGSGVHGYQRVNLIAPFLQALAERMPAVTFGWLDSSLTVGAREQLAPNLWRVAVAPDELSPYLERAKVALLIREPSGTNAAAAPTKAYQYLAAGTPVVTTPYPPSVAELCRQEGRGRVVSSMAVEEWTAAISELLAHPASNPFDAHRQAIEAWQDLLRRLADSGNARLS